MDIFKYSRSLFISLMLTGFIPCAYAQVQITGNLTAYVDNFISSLPTTNGGNEYQTPSPADLTTWGNLITNMLQGNYATAHSTASGIGYRVVEYTDNAVTPNRRYYILEKKSTSTNYWGMFIYNPSAARRKLFIQSPHPKYDSYTGKQGFAIFSNLNCRAFFVTGTHRCNSSVPSTCDGTSQVCTGQSDPYKSSDQAHVVNGTLQRTTEIFNANVTNVIIIQPHGFGKDAGDPDVIMSNGTRNTPAPDYVTMLRDNLSTVDATLTFKLAHVDLTWTSLIATDNTQGRLINGSQDPCGTAASTSSARFLHVEQAYTLRDNDADRKKLSDALAMTFPENSTVGSGDWNSTDVWMNEQVPDSTQDVVINNGHVLAITGNAQCKSISFGGTSSKLSLLSGGILSVFGDFTLASTSHQVFSAWTAGAKIRFAGPEATQTLSGWSTAGFSTGFDEILVDKSAGKVVTSGTGMRLQVGTSLEIVNGTFELGSGDGIESRNFSGTAASATITVQAGALFNMLGGASFIRRAGNTGSETSKIGSLTVFGTAYLASSSTIRINFNGINIENGGLVQFPTQRSTAASTFNPGVITIKSGGVFKNSLSTTSFWYPNTTTPPSVVINSGGEYEAAASSTTLPSGGITQNSGSSFRYSSDLPTTLPASITNYKTLILSGAGSKTLSANITISEALQLSGAFTTLTLGAFTLTYNANAVLCYGASGQLTAQTTTNAEWPASNGPQNVQIFNGGGVTLHANRTINGSLSLTNGCLILGSNNLNLGASAIISGTPGVSNMIVTNGSGSLTKSIANGTTLPYSFTFPIGENTGIPEYSPVSINLISGSLVGASVSAKVVNEKYAANFSGVDFINRYWTLTSTGISGFSADITGNFTPADINGTESNLYGGVFRAGAGWSRLAAINADTHTLSGTALSALGDFTAGEFAAMGPNTPLSITFIPEGYYSSGSLSLTDKFSVGIASSSGPDFIDVVTGTITIDSVSYSGTVLFPLTLSGSYYLYVKGRSLMETWSASPITITPGVMVSYDFTTNQTKAYGNNLGLKGANKWCVYCGDVDQSGYIDNNDLLLIDNDAFVFSTGYRVTDLDGTQFVDNNDLLICDNNAYNFIGAKSPRVTKSSLRKLPLPFTKSAEK